MKRLVVGFILALSASAALADPLPENTINCASFRKLPDGYWYVDASTTFDVGKIRSTTLTKVKIGPRFFPMGSIDLYDVLEQKCGGTSI